MVQQGSESSSMCAPYCPAPRRVSAVRNSPYCLMKCSASASVAQISVPGSTHAEAPPVWSMWLCV